MPIRINLLAETLAAEKQRRQDPVKRAIYIGAFLFVLMLAWSSVLQLRAMLANNDLTVVQSDMQAHTNDFQRVMTDSGKIADIRTKLEQLQKLNDARFLQGNLLNALQQPQLNLPNIRLIRLRVGQSYQLIAAKPAPTAVEHITISMDVRDSSPNPGDQVNKFKDLVASQPYFQSMMDKKTGIRLSNLSAPQIGPDGKPYVLFTLECQLPDQTR
jgi:hypothetical protein